MMRPSFPLNAMLETLPVYQPGRPVDEVARELGLDPSSVIKLASNENPLGPSPKAVQAMQQAVHEVHLYPDGSAYYLKQRLAAALGITPAHLVLGNGSNEVIELVGHALLGPGVDVVVSEFCFAVYPIVTRLFGGNLIGVPARAYGHDLAAMLNAVTPSTRVVFVANPNNPTGTLAPADQVMALVEGLPERVLLAMDEAYLEYLDQPLDLLPLVRSGRHPNLFLMRTFSKIHGLAGLRIGYGIGHPDFVGALEKIREPFNINSVAQAAALAALDDLEHVKRTRQTNRAGLAQLESGFQRLHVEFVPSAANFVLVRVGDGQRVFEALQRFGVIVRPMGGYQLPEWVRISVGTAPENERCLSALGQVLAAR
jgi:histidinol-phosphate aminotransferase